MRWIGVVGAIGLAALVPATAFAQGAGANCAATEVMLPAELAGWDDRTSLPAAATEQNVAMAELIPGRGAALALRPTPEVRYPVRPAKPGGSVSHGGLARFTADKAGIWRIALGSGVWIELVRNGKALPSVAHGHGPICTGIRKMVDFALEPGRYLIEIAGNGQPVLPVMVVRLC